MILICVILVFIMVVGIVILSVDYEVHINQVKNYTKKYGKGNYTVFIQEFNKCKWDSKYFKGSLFDRSSDSELHASIIKFKGVGMIMQNPIEYLKMLYYVRQYKAHFNKEEELRITHVWKEEIK